MVKKNTYAILGFYSGLCAALSSIHCLKQVAFTPASYKPAFF